MNERRARALLLLFYPFALASAVSGFLAFVLLASGIPPLRAAVITVWFYFGCSVMLCLMSRPVLGKLGLSRFFWGFTCMLGALGSALTAITLLA